MNNEQVRTEFEAACYKHAEETGYDESYVDLSRDYDGGYMDSHIQSAWWAWQARATLQSQDREGYAGVTVWADGIQCTKIITRIQYESSNADELLRHFEAARAAIDHARRAEEERK